MLPRPQTLSWIVLQSRWPRVARWLAWLQREILGGVLLAPLEPILNASRWRLAWAGLFLLFGNPLFGWFWTVRFPQPWENATLRIAVASLGLLLLLIALRFDVRSKSVQLAFNVVVFLNLPLFFNWMYLCNQGNKVWLASTVAMLLAYYHLVDWRIATLGTAAGAVVAALLHDVFIAAAPVLTGGEAHINAAVLGFAWAVAIALGFSTANERRLNLRRTLTTVGIMAHELRTPIATIGLVAQALQAQALQPDAPGAAASIRPLAERLALLVRNMNHQIDMQVTNARLLRLTPPGERLDAGRVVADALNAFPFRNAQEREVVTVHIVQDFEFISSGALFVQVIANLLNNAQRAVAAADRPLRVGDIAIRIAFDDARGVGVLIFADQGIGMAPALKQRVFEPFFSSDGHTGNGLGLAFCKRMVKSAGGSIRVDSEPGQGATFTIELPRAQPLNDA